MHAVEAVSWMVLETGVFFTDEVRASHGAGRHRCRSYHSVSYNMDTLQRQREFQPWRFMSSRSPVANEKWYYEPLFGDPV